MELAIINGTYRDPTAKINPAAGIGGQAVGGVGGVGGNVAGGKGAAADLLSICEFFSLSVCSVFFHSISQWRNWIVWNECVCVRTVGFYESQMMQQQHQQHQQQQHQNGSRPSSPAINWCNMTHIAFLVSFPLLFFVFYFQISRQNNFHPHILFNQFF